MKAQMLAEDLCGAGLPVLEVREFGNGEAEIRLDDRYCVQMGPRGTGYYLTREEGGDALVCTPVSVTVQEVIHHAKKALRLA